MNNSIVDMPTNEAVPRQVNVAGLPTMERSVFTFIMARYLSLSGKTLIIEKDFDFLTLSHIANRSNADYLEILVEDIYDNPEKEILKIRESEKRLIVVGTRQRVERDYFFICSLLYNNLLANLTYLVKENSFDELPDSTRYIAVLPNNATDLLKTTMMLPVGYENNARFVGVDMLRVEELTIKNSKQIEMIVKDVLQIKSGLNIPIFNISSLKLGGEVHDLRVLIE